MTRKRIRVNNVNVRKAKLQCLDEVWDMRQYTYIDLKLYFELTLLDDLYFRKSVVYEIYQFANQSNRLDPVPEVGGFLLGSYIDKGDRLASVVDVFLPINKVEFQSNTRLIFGSSLGVEYAKIMDAYPDCFFWGGSILILAMDHFYPK